MRGRNDRRIEDAGIGNIANDLAYLLEDAVNRRAINGLGLGAMHAEHFFQALDVTVGFVEVRGQTGLQLGVAGLLDKATQRFKICFSA